jgi:hypothetical protein
MSNTKRRVIGTYADAFKRDFLTPGTEHYMDKADLESRIANAERLGLLDEPYVEHEFQWSKASVERRRRQREELALRRKSQPHLGTGLGILTSIAVLIAVIAFVALVIVIVESLLVALVSICFILAFTRIF